MICGTAKLIDNSTNKIRANRERQERFRPYMPGTKRFKRYACYCSVFSNVLYLKGFFDRYGMFLSELFGTETIFAENNGIGCCNLYFSYGSSRTCIFTVIVGNILTKKDTQNLLDDCVILNTYNHYFVQKKDV